METVITVVSVGVGLLLIWGVLRLIVRERRLRREQAPLLGVIYPLDAEDRKVIAKKQARRDQRDTES